MLLVLPLFGLPTPTLCEPPTGRPGCLPVAPLIIPTSREFPRRSKETFATENPSQPTTGRSYHGCKHQRAMVHDHRFRADYWLNGLDLRLHPGPPKGATHPVPLCSRLSSSRPSTRCFSDDSSGSSQRARTQHNVRAGADIRTLDY
ncbi:hypothetical protein B0J18DRAFT_25774 [Chaetomium sp. MPI-SDFR-AT-0129]|nr:hypothetical protein B0J18DRAFT_25774 [Chaetomium sp. MPI-SDFR-AT-0129]